MTTTEDTELRYGVIYSDGGCAASSAKGAASRGHAGWGVHGYIYTKVKPKVGSGAKKGVPSENGYDLKAKGLGEITVVNYVDGFGTIEGEATNNVAELSGAIKCLEVAIAQGLSGIKVITDSKYVVDGASSWMSNWRQAGWLRNGQPIPNAEYWKNLSDKVELLKALGSTVEFVWVKGHNGEPGNMIVDKYATRARIATSLNKAIDVLNVTEAKGYWKRDAVPPREFTMPNVYFSTSPRMKRISAKGRSVYFQGNIRESDDFFGKPISDATFSVIHLNEPCEFVDNLIGMFDRLSAGTLQGMCVLYASEVFSSALMDPITQFGESLMSLNKTNQSINHIDRKKPEDKEGIAIGREIRPTRLAFQGGSLMQELHEILEDVLEPPATSQLVLTDVTNQLYEPTTKGNKTIVRLKPGITTSSTVVDLNINYRKGDAVETMCVTHTLRQDLPDRNMLAAVASEAVKVTAVTWLESSMAFRHAIVIETENGAGIWAGPYSNLQFIA